MIPDPVGRKGPGSPTGAPLRGQLPLQRSSKTCQAGPPWAPHVTPHLPVGPATRSVGCWRLTAGSSGHCPQPRRAVSPGKPVPGSDPTPWHEDLAPLTQPSAVRKGHPGSDAPSVPWRALLRSPVWEVPVSREPTCTANPSVSSPGYTPNGTESDQTCMGMFPAAFLIRTKSWNRPVHQHENRHQLGFLQ